MKRSVFGSRWQLWQAILALALLCSMAACGGSATPAPQVGGSSQATHSTPATSARGFSPTTWDARTAPEYYREVGTAQIDWDLPAGSVEYAPLDALGRATGVRAHVTAQLANEGRARPRDDTAELKPSGWGHNAQVDIVLADGSTYHGELWNRSHLLAKSLGGAEVLENLVTGTRMQNVGSNRNGGASGGMGYCEGLARDWLDAHPNGTLRYSATPVYLGSELVCRSVVVDLRSSDGTLDKRVEVYNAAAGYEIDYESGAFRKAEDAAASTATGAQSNAAAGVQAPTTPKAAPIKKGWLQEGGSWRHYNDDGTPSSGWLADNGLWYLLDAGDILTGWQAVDGLWYYLCSDGRLASDQWIDNTYYVDASGVMLADTRTPDGYLVDARGAYVPEVYEPEPVPEPEPTGRAYVLNHNTRKFHYPSCASAKKIKPKNREDVVMTREEIIARGFVPCKNCNP